MTADDHHQGDATDTIEVIRRHCRAIVLGLGAVDLANPQARVITDRMKEQVATLKVDVDQLRFFLPKRSET